MYYREDFLKVAFPTGLPWWLTYGLMLHVKVSTAHNTVQLLLNILRTGLNEKSHKEIEGGVCFLASRKHFFFTSVIQ